MLEILTYLMWHFLIECFESVSQSIGLKLFIQEHLLKLADHPIEDSCCDLYNLKGHTQLEEMVITKTFQEKKVATKMVSFLCLTFCKKKGM